MQDLINAIGNNAHTINTNQDEHKTYKDLLSFFNNAVKIKVLKGYSDLNKKVGEKARYQEAKAPVSGKFDGKFENEWWFDKPEDLEGMLQYECWVGMYIPDGYILVDIDDKKVGAVVAQAFLERGIKCIILETPNGYQFLFKDTGKIKTQRAKFITMAGIVVDYRLSGKGYTVLPTPTTENRKIIHIPDSVDPMPDFFVSVRHMKKEGEEEILQLPLFEGSRHVTFHAHVCRMRAWNHKYNLNVNLEEIAMQMNDLFISPPLEEKEILGMIKASEQLALPDPVREETYNTITESTELKDMFKLDYTPSIPNGFDIIDGELIHLKGKDEKNIPIPICQPFVITATIKPEDGEETCFIVKDNSGKEAVLGLTISDKKNFEQEICNFLERPIDSEKIKLLQKYVGEYFRANHFDFTQKSGLSRTGWHHKTFYIPTREYKDVCWLDDNLKDAYCCKGDSGHQRIILRDVLKTPASVVVLSALSAPLLKLFHIPNPIIFISGPKGKGKSTSAGFAVSLFGNPRCLKGTWFSTKVGKEGFLYMNTDLPAWIDEIETLGENTGDVINSCYTYESGSGKMRGNKNLLNRKTKRLSGVLLITSEKDLDSLITSISNRRSAPLGIYRRTIEVKVDEDFFTCIGSGKKFNLTQLNKFFLINFGWMGREWIHFIENNIAGITEMYKKNLQVASRIATLEGAFSAMFTALDILLSMKIIDEEIYNTISKYISSVALEHRNKNQQVDDIAYKFKSKLADFCNMNERMFIGLGYDYDKSAGFWGRVEEAHVFLLKETFERICKESGFVSSHILKALQKQGDLETQRGFEKQIRHGNNRHWGYYIKNVIELDEQPNPFLAIKDEKVSFEEMEKTFLKM